MMEPMIIKSVPGYGMPKDHYTDDFEFSAMFDNIDQLEIDINDAYYQKFITDSLTLKAIKDITKKLQKLRKDF